MAADSSRIWVFSPILSQAQYTVHTIVIGTIRNSSRLALWSYLFSQQVDISMGLAVENGCVSM